MKMVRTLLIGKVAVGLLLSGAPLYGVADVQQPNEQKNEQSAAWSTRAKVIAGVGTCGLLGAAGYATYRYKPEVIAAIAYSLNNSSNRVRSFLGYEPKSTTLQKLGQFFGYQKPSVMQRVTGAASLAWQKSLEYACNGYHQAVPLLANCKDVTIKLAQEHPYALLGAFVVPSTGGAYKVYARYGKDGGSAELSSVNDPKISDQEFVKTLKEVLEKLPEETAVSKLLEETAVSNPLAVVNLSNGLTDPVASDSLLSVNDPKISDQELVKTLKEVLKPSEEKVVTAPSPVVKAPSPVVKAPSPVVKDLIKKVQVPKCTHPNIRYTGRSRGGSGRSNPRR
ncbi:MAG: hypothetical protein WD068_02810 [Candidatus Babeliales bacterium]